MVGELDVLRVVAERLESGDIAYMLTGSYALAHYTVPRMTRDLDFVISLSDSDVDTVVSLFSSDFYIDRDDVSLAIRSQRMFNLMHFESGIKLDFIIRKGSEYRQVEFARRQKVTMGGVALWITSREDLILSKLLWSMDSKSELQRRDIRSLIRNPVDNEYLQGWATRLNVKKLLEEIDQ